MYLFISGGHERATIRLIQQSGYSDCWILISAQLWGEDWVCRARVVLSFQTSWIFNDIGVTTRAIWSVLKGNCWFVWHLALMSGRTDLRLPHHVSLGLLRQSAIVQNNVRITSWTITRVICISWVMSAHHPCLNWRVRIGSRLDSAWDCLVYV